jgi:transketolase
MREAFIRELTQSAEHAGDIVLVTADLGFKVFDEYRARFPARFINVGVAEQNMIGVSAGLAARGRRVFAYSIGVFPTLRCLDQIRNLVAYHGLPVAIVSVGAGFGYGALGYSHHGLDDISATRGIASLRVYAPCDAEEAAMLTRAWLADPHPAYFRLERAPVAAGPQPPLAPFGGWRTMREGKDVALLATGSITEEALRVADLLASRDIHASVFAAHTIKPLDLDGLAGIARQHPRLAAIEEHMLCGGFTSAVAEALADLGLLVPLMRFGVREPLPDRVGGQAYLRAQHRLDALSMHDDLLARYFPDRRAG